MRIGIFSETYTPYISGLVTSEVMLKKALEKQGHDVYVVTANIESFKYEYDEKEKILRIPGLPTGIYDSRLTSIYPVKAVKKIRSWNLDVIHSQTEFAIGTFARLIAKQYNIAFSTVYRINSGESWNDSTLSYPIRTWNELGHFGEASGRSKLTDEEVLKIRKRYVNETPREIWADYKDLYSLSGFSKVCRGETYKNVPIYNKTTKTWSSL